MKYSNLFSFGGFFCKMWAKISTIKRTKDLNYFSLCSLNLFNTRVSQFELNYWNKWTFPWHSNILRCTHLPRSKHSGAPVLQNKSLIVASKNQMQNTQKQHSSIVSQYILNNEWCLRSDVLLENNKTCETIDRGAPTLFWGHNII